MAGFLNAGDSLTFASAVGPIAGLGFNVEVLDGAGEARLLADLDGDVIRSAAGLAAGASPRSTTVEDARLSVPSLRDGDRIEFRLDEGRVLVDDTGLEAAATSGFLALFAAGPATRSRSAASTEPPSRSPTSN